MFYRGGCLCSSICVDRINDFFYSKPNTHICKDFRNAPTIRKRRFQQNRKIFHHSIMNNILNDLIYKINLPAVQIYILKIL